MLIYMKNKNKCCQPDRKVLLYICFDRETDENNKKKKDKEA